MAHLKNETISNQEISTHSVKTPLLGHASNHVFRETELKFTIHYLEGIKNLLKQADIDFTCRVRNRAVLAPIGIFALLLLTSPGVMNAHIVNPSISEDTRSSLGIIAILLRFATCVAILCYAYIIVGDGRSIYDLKAKFFNPFDDNFKNSVIILEDLIMCMQIEDGKKIHQILSSFDEPNLTAKDFSLKIKNIYAEIEALKKDINATDLSGETNSKPRLSLHDYHRHVSFFPVNVDVLRKNIERDRNIDALRFSLDWESINRVFGK